MAEPMGVQNITSSELKQDCGCGCGCADNSAGRQQDLIFVDSVQAADMKTRTDIDTCDCECCCEEE